MIPLEDNFTDVLGKALRGQKLSVHAAAARAGLDTAAVTRLITGHFEEGPARSLAVALKLNGDALVRLASGEYAPDLPCPPAITAVTTLYGDMTVNAYIVQDRESRDSAIFDTGADAKPLLDAVRSSG